MTDIRDLNARAVRDSMDIVRQVQVTDLGRPTPCEGWTLADLLGHMTVQHHGFAAASRGDGADMKRWEFAAAGPDAVQQYLAASEEVLAAYAELGADLDTVFDLPEFQIDPPRFPARVAIGFHFIDYIVHAWDVAATLGLPFDLRPELEQEALRITLAVPNGDNRTADGSAFVPALEIPEDASALDQILLHLGRTPGWRPIG
ncbi:TIGR03086 family metal-binding protein [Catenulispora pinisilvae]|uniref:TIGR03086 family metal-binding protein n=1 Tax=Catenulispora pinisilvae TaxID=2705253 RepID=UPI0018914AED|nr:TIGR03086 family metal-binding protein [Catenulispora pinisilvae]